MKMLDQFTVNLYKNLVMEAKPAIIINLPEVIEKPTTRKRKGSYYISARRKEGETVEKVNGYLFDVDGLKVGACKPFTRGPWNITDIKTGFLIGTAVKLEEVPTTAAAAKPAIVKAHAADDKRMKAIIERIHRAYIEEV